jgi:hypothetical protein
MMRLPEIDAGNLSAPIPGMSLTTEPGNRPWENPPQIVNIEDAVSFYAEKILDPEKQDAILNAFTEEVSIESMADMVTTSAVMEGIHTIDLSILINPVVQEMFRYVGDINNVKYIESYEELDKKKRIPEHEARSIVEDIAKEMDASKVPPMPGAESKEELPMDVKPPVSMRGLMAKPMSEEV